jgi:hypothetical protein
MDNRSSTFGMSFFGSTAAAGLSSSLLFPFIVLFRYENNH